MDMRIKRFDKDFPLPETEAGAAGFDFSFRESATIQSGEVKLVSINAAVEIPEGYFMMITLRSSTPLRRGLMMPNAPGIIDPFYSGDKDEIRVQLYNFTNKPVTVEMGEQLVQGVILRHYPPNWQEVDTFGHDGHGGYHISGNAL